jgi:hypothetical protein
MCTVKELEAQALVCDIALPFVRAALASDPELVIEYRPKPGDGTEVRLASGDPAAFNARVRAAVAGANP